MEPWLALLQAGDSAAAWDSFHSRYRRLILATIRRLVRDPDDVMEVYANACQALAADDCARLRRYSADRAGPAGAGTWVVAVVRNLTVDWLRRRDGRHRFSVPASLTPLQQAIYTAICLEGRSHAEAYEVLRARDREVGAFHEFLRAVRATHLAAPCPQHLPPRRPGARRGAGSEPAVPPPQGAESAEAAQRVGEALQILPPDVRLAVMLYVVDRLPAVEVARLVGWPNAKAVYNRVTRALTRLRVQLEQAGIRAGDL